VVVEVVAASVFDPVFAVLGAAPVCGLNDEPPSPPPQAPSISPAHTRAIGEIRRIVILRGVGEECLDQTERIRLDATASTKPS